MFVASGNPQDDGTWTQDPLGGAVVPVVAVGAGVVAVGFADEVDAVGVGRTLVGVDTGPVLVGLGAAGVVVLGATGEGEALGW